jgi:hypothetical protein
MPIPFHNLYTVRLGRRPHDPARLSTVRPHRMSATAPPPASLLRPDIAWTPTLADNNTLPTCTVAGLMNAARMWALTHGRFDLTNDDGALLAFYASLAGCADNTAAIAATDGLVLLDVLDRAETSGFDCGEQAPLVPEFTAIDVTSPAAIRDAIYTHGAAYLGVTLHEADMSGPWTTPVADAGGMVGGHCIVAWRYDAANVGLATWGMTIEADWGWLAGRLDEAFALSWPQLDRAP